MSRIAQLRAVVGLLWGCNDLDSTPSGPALRDAAEDAASQVQGNADAATNTNATLRWSRSAPSWSAEQAFDQCRIFGEHAGARHALKQIAEARLGLEDALQQFVCLLFVRRDHA